MYGEYEPAAWIWFAAGLLVLSTTAVMIASGWRLLQKAGRPGWPVLVPVYGPWVALELLERPRWWLVPLLLPGVGVVFAVVLAFDVAKAYGRSPAFGVGLIALLPVFAPILAFGDAPYRRPIRHAQSSGARE